MWMLLLMTALLLIFGNSSITCTNVLYIFTCVHLFVGLVPNKVGQLFTSLLSIDQLVCNISNVHVHVCTYYY